MGNLTTALVFVLTLNVFIWISQMAILEVNPSGTEFFNCSNSIVNGVSTGCSSGTGTVLNANPLDNLPESNQVSSSSNPFTDLFNSILGWFKNVTGLNYVISIVSAPYNLLVAIGLPTAIAGALGVLWYGITFFLILSFLWWRD
jgi:hypothetical protein